MQDFRAYKNVAHITPRPDEAAVGILGLLMQANACVSRELTIVGLKNLLGLPPSASPWAALAEALGMQQDEIAYRHSWIPLLRAISATVGKDKQSTSIAQTLSKQGLVRIRHNARYCLKCVEDDRKDGQRSYWHRTHLLPSIDWCITHKTPLAVVAPKAFDFSPEDIRDEGVEEQPTAIDAELNHPALQRYADLLTRWLGARESISSAALVNVLQQRCKVKGLRSGQHGNRPLISDIAREMLPATWIARHMPELLNKEHGKYFQRLDGAAKDRHVAYAASASALCLSLLFDSVDEVESSLRTENQKFLAKISAKAIALPDVIESAKRAFAEGASITAVCRSYDLTLEQLEPSFREAVRALSRPSACLA